MTKLSALLKVAALALVAVVALATSSSARTRVEVRAIDSTLTEANGLATANFKIQVQNSDEAAITAARVVFPGGIEVAVGDVAAGATVVTGAQKFVFNADDLPATKNVPVTVTLKFTSGDAAAEVSAILTFKRAE